MLPEPRLDLPQLDAEPADLHLKIVAAQKLDIAVGQIATKVPGPVHPRPGFIYKRIPEKLLCRQIRPVQIAPRYARPANVQLP